jgi:type VI secretion system protein ImpM
MVVAFGAFGKMPALGDFFRIGLGPGFTDPWDGWLREAMAAARSALGARWQGCYLSAPIWRFTLAAGVAGPSPAMGILMPSVDRVGRQFPLTLALPLPDGAGPVAWHLAAGDCFARLEAVALDALEDGATRETLAAALGALAPPAGPGAARQARHGGTLAIAGAAAGDGAALAAALAGEQRRAPVLWSAVIEAETLMWLTEGLPRPDLATLLFDAEAPPWRHGGNQGQAA